MIQRLGIRIPLTRFGVTPTELLSVFLCILFFAGWLSSVMGEVSIQLLPALTVVMASYWMAGTIAIRLLSLRTAWRGDFPMTMLLGYCLINTSLFVLALASPFSILINLCLIMAVSVGLLPATVGSPSSNEPEASAKVDVAALVWLFICLLGTTFWARESLMPIIHRSGEVLITPWADSFIHAALIRMLSEAHGSASLQSVLLAGAPAPLYHYASYMAPAFLTKTADLNAFDVFTGFVVPGGLFMSCLAAYVLIRTFWSPWPAYLASLSLLLFPNSSFHGLMIPWFSYHWLTLISPSLAYGLAAFAPGWALMFEGLRESRMVLIFASLFTMCLSALFKVYFLVSFSFMALIYPLLFHFRIPPLLRLGGVLTVASLFLLGFETLQHFSALPRLQLDFSAAYRYGQMVTSQVENGVLRAGISMLKETSSWVRSPVDAVVIYWGTFGVFGLACPAAVLMLRRKMDLCILCFPIFTMGCYMFFSLGLAFDEKLGQEHFLHRHFAWAYLVACSWTAGALYWSHFGDDPPPRPFARWVLVITVAALLFLSYLWGHQVQKGPLWGTHFSWQTVPAGFVQSCYFIRDRSRDGDIIQDSKNDPRCLATALCGRQAYVIDYWLLHETLPPMARERIQDLQRFKSLNSEEEVLDFASARGIRWYLLHPEDIVLWPPQVANRFSFECDGFRVYEFEQGSVLKKPGEVR
ncbi:MAG: hypothetical protein GX443_13125 [Deltaproteobacteria bacterium]|nr:hypothetical protein [Deltaproteobacteria bacterium]